ncbi:hypothetical protein MRX96_032765 [Rhipicephalus microplus]
MSSSMKSTRKQSSAKSETTAASSVGSASSSATGSVTGSATGSATGSVAGSVTDGALANPKLAASHHKLAPVRRKNRQRLHRQSKAERGPQGPVSISASKSSMTQDTQADEKVVEGRVQKDGVPSAAGSKAPATADGPAKPGDVELAHPATSENPKATAFTSLPWSSEHPAASSSDTAAPKTSANKGKRGTQSLNALIALLDVRAKTPSSKEEKAGLDLRRIVKVLLVLFVIIVVLGFVVFLRARGNAQRERFCTTKGCEEHKRRIEGQLDKSVDPCDDFGAHVCGGWASRKEFLLSRSQMTDMHLAWLYKLPTTLEAGVARFPVGMKVDAMFKSCMTPGKSQVSLMKEFMKERGIMWPEQPPENVTPAMVLFDLSFNWNVHLWLTLKVLPEIPGKVKRRLFFAPNDLMLFWKAVFNEIPDQYLESVYAALFKMCANDASKVPDVQKAALTLQTLRYVFNTLVPSCPCKARTPALIHLIDIDNITSLPIAAHMKDMFNAVLGIAPPVTLDEMLLWNDLSLIENVWTILEHFNDTVLLRHLSYLFVYAYAAVAYPTGFLQAIHGSKTRAKEELPRFCAVQIEPAFKLLVAAMASVAHFTDLERHHIVEYLEHIVEVASNKTMASDWMDTKIKNAALEKLSNVHTVLWPSQKFLTANALENVYKIFPDSASSFTKFWIETRRSQRQLFGSEAAAEELVLGDNAQLPYVTYVDMLNRLSLSLGALAPPLYYPDGTHAMLHGGVLYMYARALMGAIDNKGITINSQGEMMTSWASDDVLDTFEQRILGCLPDNVSIFPEVPAMEVAYEAFKLHFGEDETQLSEELTEEKVFFITACLSTCATTPADNLYGGDCNKAVMNFAPFAKAFSCPEGSKMNPVTKCSFYD